MIWLNDYPVRLFSRRFADLHRQFLAMMEAVLLLATIAQKFRLASTGHLVTPWPSPDAYQVG